MRWTVAIVFGLVDFLYFVQICVLINLGGGHGFFLLGLKQNHQNKDILFFKFLISKAFDKMNHSLFLRPMFPDVLDPGSTFLHRPATKTPRPGLQSLRPSCNVIYLPSILGALFFSFLS